MSFRIFFFFQERLTRKYGSNVKLDFSRKKMGE